jgi:hypothetical protein
MVRPPGVAEPLDLAAEFQRLTYEIVTTSLPVVSTAQNGPGSPDESATYFDTFGRIDLASILNLPSWLPTPAALRARPALAVFRSIVDRIVAQRRQDPGREVRDLLARSRAFHSLPPREREQLVDRTSRIASRLVAHELGRPVAYAPVTRTAPRRPDDPYALAFADPGLPPFPPPEALPGGAPAAP